MRDLYNNITVTQVVAPAVATATVTSSAIDLQGSNRAVVVFNIGASGDTLSGSVYWTLSMTECDTSNGTYTAVDVADLHNSAATIVIDSNSEDETAVKFGYKGSKRYLKAVATKTGTHSNGTPIGIVSVLSSH